jgi:hypothetical protein
MISSKVPMLYLLNRDLLNELEDFVPKDEASFSKINCSEYFKSESFIFTSSEKKESYLIIFFLQIIVIFLIFSIF